MTRALQICISLLAAGALVVFGPTHTGAHWLGATLIAVFGVIIALNNLPADLPAVRPETSGNVWNRLEANNAKTSSKPANSLNHSENASLAQW